MMASNVMQHCEQFSTGTISYLTAGKPGGLTPIVFLHGIGSNATSFARLLPMAAEKRQAFAWDAPGYGDSRPLDADWPDADDYAAAFDGFLDDIGVEKAIIVGHSLGAMIAARFAARHPARVVALALLSPALGYGAIKGAPLPQAQQARIDELASLGGAEFARQRASRLVFQPDAKPEVYKGVEQAMADVSLGGYSQAVRLLATGDIFADVPALDAMPILIGCGAEDIVVPPEKAERLLTALRNSAPGAGRDFRLFAGCGHALPQEMPAALWMQLEEFAALHHCNWNDAR